MNRVGMALAGLSIVGALLQPSTLIGAQEVTGEISGTVTDPSGTALAGVTVSLSGGDAPSSSQLTGADGSYRFTALPHGVYELEFRQPGFAPENRSRVVVAEGTETVEDVTLRDSRDYSVTLNVDSLTTSVMTSRANVTTSTPEANPGDEAASEDTTVTTQADLAIEMSASADPVIAGTEMSYAVTVTNGGPSVARIVEVTYTLPAGVTFGATSGCAEDPVGVPVCTLGTVAPADSARYTIAVKVNPGTVGRITNQVSVNAQTVEIGPGDESATVGTAVDTRADLVMTRSAAPDPVVAGTPLSYTVTVANNGPSDAREVLVEETLPAGVTLDATAGCAEDPSAIPDCTLGTIPAGGSRRYTIALLVDSAVTGSLPSEASVSSLTAEASPGAESVSMEVEVEARADLVTTVGSPDLVIAGTQLSYTITVSNNGPSDAQGVGISASLPPPATLSSTSGCDEDPRGVPTCSLGTIAAGASRQITAVVAVDSATLGVITTQLSATSQTSEAKPGDESIARDTAVDARADLVVTARDSVDPAIAGEPLTYTVQVANNGPSAARDVVVKGELPAMVTFQATAGCVEDGDPGGGAAACTLGTIAAGTSKSYTISVLVDADATGVITNRASVTSSTVEARPGDETVPAAAAGNPALVSDPSAFVRFWAQAWSGKRIDDYLRCYSDEFTPVGDLSRKQWERLRRARIELAGEISVQLSEIETEVLGPGRSRVSFTQDYRSRTYSDTVRKTLELVREQGRWSIVSERAGG